jgi:hypothetical protein
MSTVWTQLEPASSCAAQDGLELVDDSIVRSSAPNVDRDELRDLGLRDPGAQAERSRHQAERAADLENGEQPDHANEDPVHDQERSPLVEKDQVRELELLDHTTSNRRSISFFEAPALTA